MSKCKKCRSRKCKCKKRRRCTKKSYQRDYIVRTTKCKGGCVPTTSQILNSMQPFGGQFTQCCDGRVVGCGTVGCGVSNLTESTESHLHMDAFGRVYGHKHPGGHHAHSHDVEGKDRYVGPADLRSLTRNPDSLDADVFGGIPSTQNLSPQACNTDAECLSGQFCIGGKCALIGADPGIGSQAPVPATTQTSFGGVQRNTGNLVGGFSDAPGNGCNTLNFTSGSFVDGSTLAIGNLAASAPSNPSTLHSATLNTQSRTPNLQGFNRSLGLVDECTLAVGNPAATVHPSILNARQITPNLQGFNNEGISCITGALCGSKRPTVCRTKIKEVYCC